MSTRPKAYSWLRVDLADYLRGVLLGTREVQDSNARLILPHPLGAVAEVDGRILQGFALTITGAGSTLTCTISNSRALLAEVVDGVTHYGQFCEDELGAATVVMTTAAFPAVNADYDIFIRFLTSPGNPGSRAYWNATVSAETLQVRDMDDQPMFELGVGVVAAPPAAATPPAGGGWLRIYRVHFDGAMTFSALVDRRSYLFEGRADGASWAPFSYDYYPTWGDGANDRNADRGLHGVHDLATFVQFTRRQLADILGGATKPWENPRTLPTLYTLLAEHWGETGAGATHHKAITTLWSNVLGAVNMPRLVWHGVDAGGTTRESEVALDAVYATDLEFRRTTGDSVLTVVTHDGTAAAQPGILLSSRLGSGADIEAGKYVYLRFGKREAVFNTSRDFALRAFGAAADAGLALDFTAGAGGGTVRFRITGDGYAKVQTDFGYLAAKTWSRCLDASAFLVRPHAAAGTAPWVIGDQLLNLTTTAQFSSVTIDSLGQPFGLAWAIYDADTYNIAGEALASMHAACIAPLHWIPDGTSLVDVDLLYTTGTGPTGAWNNTAGNENGLAVSIWRYDNTALPIAVPPVCVCRARFQPPDGGAQMQWWGATAWTHGGAWGTGTIDHTTYSYFLIVSVDTSAGAPAPIAGAIGFASVRLGFTTLYLKN